MICPLKNLKVQRVQIIYPCRGSSMQENYFDTIKNELEKGRPICEATIVEVEGTTPREIGTSMIIKADGSSLGTIGGGGLEYTTVQEALQFIECQNCGIKEVVSYKDHDENKEIISRVKVFLKVYLPKDKIIIFGGGHVGSALYKHAIHTNFLVVMADDREGFLSKEKYPQATQLIKENVLDKIKEELITANSYVMVASSTHKSDEEILKRVLQHPCQYIGMLGSKRKVERIFNNLKAQGIKEEKLERVYSPVGLKIGGQTPEEVALSIIAEMVAVKNGKEKEVKHMKEF